MAETTSERPSNEDAKRARETGGRNGAARTPDAAPDTAPEATTADAPGDLQRESASAASDTARQRAREGCFNNAEVGAIAHLYRGEVYRSTIWRTRLDATTNWSVVSLGVALSITYSSPTASPLPLLLVGVLITVFLFLEARRYRYFNVWRARARWMEIHFYAPLLKRLPYEDEGRWQQRLAEDYERPEHHISSARAFGRRLRRNYLWIFSVQALAYFGKVTIHPEPVANVDEFFGRMTVGPAPGWMALVLMLIFHGALIGITLRIYALDRKKFREQPNPLSMG